MTQPPKDPMDYILESILSDDSPMTAEDEEDAAQARQAIEQAKIRLALERLSRARAAALADHGHGVVTDLAKEKARELVERARAGDKDAMLTMAARFGDGSMDRDMEAIIEDIAEVLEDEDDQD